MEKKLILSATLTKFSKEVLTNWWCHHAQWCKRDCLMTSEDVVWTLITGIFWPRKNHKDATCLAMFIKYPVSTTQVNGLWWNIKNSSGLINLHYLRMLLWQRFFNVWQFLTIPSICAFKKLPNRRYH